ncbi:MAG: hypothetical protein AAGI38_08045 [Bacteroidota bacterium]
MNIQKSEAYNSKAPKVEKIVSIEPSVGLSDVRKRAENRYLISDKSEKVFNKVLAQSAKRAGIEMVLLDAESLTSDDVLYFNELLPLRTQILGSNFLKEVEIKRPSSSSLEALVPTHRVFEEAPNISSQWSHLANVYGTPYFAVHGVYSEIRPTEAYVWLFLCVFPPATLIYLFDVNAESVFYTAVVDVTSGEVVYREIRSFSDKPTRHNLPSITYDSFAVLKKIRKK